MLCTVPNTCYSEGLSTFLQRLFCSSCSEMQTVTVKTSNKKFSNHYVLLWFLELLVIWCGFTILSLCSSLSVTRDLTKLQIYFVLHCSLPLPPSNSYSIEVQGSCCDLCVTISSYHLVSTWLSRDLAWIHMLPVTSVPLLIRSKAWDILPAIILTWLHPSPPLKLSSGISYFRKPMG